MQRNQYGENMISNTSSFSSGSRRAQPASQAIKEINVVILSSFLHMTACRVSGNLLLQCYIRKTVLKSAFMCIF